MVYCNPQMSDLSDLLCGNGGRCVFVGLSSLYSPGYVLISFEGGKEMGRCQRGLGFLRRGGEEFSKVRSGGRGGGGFKHNFDMLELDHSGFEHSVLFFLFLFIL